MTRRALEVRKDHHRPDYSRLILRNRIVVVHECEPALEDSNAMNPNRITKLASKIFYIYLS